MTDQKNQHDEHPLTTGTVNGGSTKTDEESGNKLRPKRRTKCFLYIALFVIFQTGIITLFALTVMRIKNPKLRIGAITVTNLNTTASPSFELTFAAQITVKNTNFGHYKFEETTVNFTQGGTRIGQVVIPRGRARARSTKKVDVTVDLRSNGMDGGGEVGSGILKLNGKGKMGGKVILMKVIKRKKSVEMDCVITVNMKSKSVEALNCN